ncbi:proprotein convertase P-domain-containing protein [Sorangium sp. So ce281]|uniref:proprotein convertase P-domain-containing protein n=1 Tax=unclassified Sorangium TaxID=2621164 RepID=UPI003F5D6DDC
MRSRHYIGSSAALGAAALMLAGCGASEGDGLGRAHLAIGQELAEEAEPNGTALQANAISSDTVVRASLFPDGDTDLFSFQAPAGSRVYAAVMTAFSTASQDADLDILDQDGTTVLETDVFNGSFGGLSPSIAGTPLATAGTYYARVRVPSATIQLRPYDLHLKVQSGVPMAEVEPNDTTPQALPVTGWIAGTHSGASDVDSYSLSLNAGDTLFASLDQDPTRDLTQFAAALAIGPFGSGFDIQVDNQSGPVETPYSDAIFATVKAAGTYRVTVTGSVTAGDYGLSVSVHPAASSVGCTTYDSANVPRDMVFGAPTTSFIDVPGAPRIGDLNVSVRLSHPMPPDVDVYLVSPAGNTNGLFTDIGDRTYPNLELTIDDEAAFPAGHFTLLNGMMVQPELDYRLHWFDGENGGGRWTLTLGDDTDNSNNLGVLSAWSLRICDAPIPALSCSSGDAPSTRLSADFERGAQGFTHAGTADAWALGTPSAAPIATCNGGTQCWKTNLSGAYNASSNQDLVSPPIDLSGVQAPIQLRWAMKYQLDNASSDHGWVEIREVGGANARRLWEFLDASMTTTVGSSNLVLQESAGWGTHYADISGYAGKQVEVVFHLDSDASVQLAGLAIDDVSVLGCPRSSTGEGGSPGGGSTTGEGGATGSGGGGAGTGGATATSGAVTSGGSTTGEGGATGSGGGGAGTGTATAASGTGASGGSTTGEGGATGSGAGGATGSGAGGAGTGTASAVTGAGTSGGTTTGEGGATASGAGGAGTGTATAASGAGAGSNDDPLASTDTTGGCGCRFAGSDEPPWPWPAALALIALLRMRRKRLRSRSS